MPSNEVEFLFKARDEVSAQLAKINQQIAATGTTLGQTTAKGQGFTAWMREQRTQQRNMNFLFGKGSQVVGTLAIGLTALNGATLGATQGTKQMTNALTQGFAAFAAIEFSVGALLGPWGLLVAAIGGTAFGLAAYNAEVANTIRANKEAAASLDILRAKAGGWDTEVIVELGKAWRSAKEESEKYQKQSSGDVSTRIALQRKELEARIAYQEAVKKFGKDVASVVKKDADDARAASDKLVKAAEDEKRAFENLFSSIFPLQAKQAEMIKNKIDLYQKLGGAAIDAIQKEASLGGKSLRELPQVEQSQLPDVNATLNLQEEIIANFREMGSVTEQVGATISNTMTNAAEIMAGVMMGSIDRIDEAFKALIQSMIAELIKIGFLRLFTAFVTGGASLPIGPLQASGTFKTTPGQVPTEGGGVTVNINVAPESKSTTVAERKRAMKLIEDAIFSEK